MFQECRTSKGLARRDRCFALCASRGFAQKVRIPPTELGGWVIIYLPHSRYAESVGKLQPRVGAQRQPWESGHQSFVRNPNGVAFILVNIFNRQLQPFQGCDQSTALRIPGLPERNPGLEFANAFSVSRVRQVYNYRWMRFRSSLLIICHFERSLHKVQSTRHEVPSTKSKPATRSRQTIFTNSRFKSFPVGPLGISLTKRIVFGHL